MKDNGQGVARFFFRSWIVIWIVLAVSAFRHTYNWDPKTPFITSDLVDMWFLCSLLLGAYASFSAWWQATAENNPWKSLTLWQALGWVLGHLVYVLIVVGFYFGVLLGMLFALEATIQRYATTIGGSTTVPVFVPFSPDTMQYLLLVTFLIVAIAQTLIVGAPMARWLIKRLNSWLKLDSQASFVNEA